MFAEEMQPAREHAPIPPLARDRGQHPRAKRTVLELVVPQHGQAKSVRGKRIVVIDADVVDEARPPLRVDRVEEWGEIRGVKPAIAQPVAEAFESRAEVV